MTIGGGRPYWLAELPEETLSMQIREDFFRIINTLNYRQLMGLGRALFINPNSIRQHYKTRRRFPGIEVAQRVIEWDRRGRPLTTRKAVESYIDF